MIYIYIYLEERGNAVRRRAKVYIFFMLCCHCVDLCHDRCACLAGQNALIKKVSFWSARGRGWYGVVLSGSPPPFILSLSLSLQFFLYFAQFLLRFCWFTIRTTLHTNQEQKRTVYACSKTRINGEISTSRILK